MSDDGNDGKRQVVQVYASDDKRRSAPLLSTVVNSVAAAVRQAPTSPKPVNARIVVYRTENGFITEADQGTVP